MSPETGRCLIFVLIGLGVCAVSLWEIAHALRSGRLRLRVSTITRSQHPRLFWFDIAACGFTAILAALFAYHFIGLLLHQS